MSVNLHLSLRISGFDPARAAAVKDAVQAVMRQETLDEDLPPLAELTVDGRPVLESRSDREFPVIVSGAYQWVPRVQAALARAAVEANGGACEVEFEGEDADEGEGVEGEGED